MIAKSIICIGGSSGSIDILEEVLLTLPQVRPFALVILIHRGENSTEMLGRKLQSADHTNIIEPCDKDDILAGGIYLAPANYHLLVASQKFCLTIDEPVRYSRPSIDILFESASESFGANATAIVLSGGNSDGAIGSQKIDECGGQVIIQDPATAKSPSMPLQTKQLVPHAKVLTPQQLSLYFTNFPNSIGAH